MIPGVMLLGVSWQIGQGEGPDKKRFKRCRRIEKSREQFPVPIIGLPGLEPGLWRVSEGGRALAHGA